MRDKETLRTHLRALRNQLTKSEQKQASINLAQHIFSLGLLDDCDSLAVYLPNDGEIDPFVIVELARQHSIPVYLPVLDKDKIGHLNFHQWLPDTAFINNKFGIPEPVDTEQIDARQLHTVFVPLVGFDDKGGRLGMGGGFYDKTFEFERNSKNAARLIGLAHECQKVPALELEPWDIPMSQVVTDRGNY